MHPLNNADSLWYFLPESFLTVCFVLIFLLDLSKGLAGNRRFMAGLTMFGLLGYIALPVYSLDFPKAVIVHGMMVVDPFTNFFRIFCAATTLLAVYFSLRSKALVVA